MAGSDPRSAPPGQANISDSSHQCPFTIAQLEDQLVRRYDSMEPSRENIEAECNRLTRLLEARPPEMDATLRYYAARRAREQLAVLLARSGVANRVYALKGKDIGARGPAIDLLQRAVRVAQEDRTQIRVDLELERLFDAVITGSSTGNAH